MADVSKKRRGSSNNLEQRRRGVQEGRIRRAGRGRIRFRESWAVVEDAAVQKAVAWREERQFVPAWRCLREVARAVVRGRVGSKVGGEGKVAPTGEVAAAATPADRVAGVVHVAQEIQDRTVSARVDRCGRVGLARGVSNGNGAEQQTGCECIGADSQS